MPRRSLGGVIKKKKKNRDSWTITVYMTMGGGGGGVEAFKIKKYRGTFKLCARRGAEKKDLSTPVNERKVKKSKVGKKKNRSYIASPTKSCWDHLRNKGGKPDFCGEKGKTVRRTGRVPKLKCAI